MGKEKEEEEEAKEDDNVELEDLALEDASLAMSNIVGGPGGEGWCRRGEPCRGKGEGSFCAESWVWVSKSGEI